MEGTEILRVTKRETVPKSPTRNEKKFEKIKSTSGGLLKETRWKNGVGET